jgi:hypothetical protein
MIYVLFSVFCVFVADGGPRFFFFLISFGFFIDSERVLPPTPSCPRYSPSPQPSTPPPYRHTHAHTMMIPPKDPHASHSLFSDFVSVLVFLYYQTYAAVADFSHFLFFSISLVISFLNVCVCVCVCVQHNFSLLFVSSIYVLSYRGYIYMHTWNHRRISRCIFDALMTMEARYGRSQSFPTPSSPFPILSG